MVAAQDIGHVRHVGLGRKKAPGADDVRDYRQNQKRPDESRSPATNNGPVTSYDFDSLMLVFHKN